MQKRDDEHALAKRKTAAKDKRGAIMHLKKKKMYDKELEQLLATRFQLDSQMQMLEASVMQASTVSVMRDATVAQRQQLAAIGGIDAVEDAMDDVADIRAEQEEISEALGGGMALDLDDPELLGELEDLEEGMLDEQLAGLDAAPVGVAGGAVAAPAAPAPVAAEDDEMAELNALMMAA